jgi:DNA polymerase-3 subunit chi
MTRIDFYTNAASKDDVARKLIVKAFKAKQYVFVYTQDHHQARALDEYLWTSPQLSFLPHVLCGHPLAAKSPVIIGDDPKIAHRTDVLLNIGVDIPDSFPRFERLLEIVTEELDDKELARGRFRYYKERGYSLEVHDLTTLR